MNRTEFLLSTILGAVLGALLQIFLVEPLIGPVLSNKITFFRKRIFKLIKPPKVPITIYSSSSVLGGQEYSGIRDALLDNMNERSSFAESVGNSIRFSDFEYGLTLTDGFIRFSLTRENIINTIEIENISLIPFNHLDSKLTGLVSSTSEIKEIVTKSMNMPLDFTDNLLCKLNNLKSLSGIFGQIDLNYIHLSGDVDFDLGQNQILLYKIIGPESLHILKKAIIAFY